MTNFRALLCLAALAAGCSGEPRTLHITTTAELEPSVAEIARFIDYPIEVSVAGDPEAALPPGELALSVAVDIADCSGDCYEIAAAGSGYAIHGGTAIGAQYGLFRALGGLGFGFFHPQETRVPDKLPAALPESLLRGVVEPEVAERRLHLHTLHPIEPYFAFWEPGEDNLEDAKRIVNWAIAIGANNIQWTALDNILDPAAGNPWREHTRAILDYIHARGVKAGIGIQLFGTSNLQQAYDLVDDVDGDVQAQIEDRYPGVLDSLDWDHVSLSFGEFLGEDPDVFIADTDLAYQALEKQAPGTTMSGTIHVGADQRVDYMGESLLYYFLVKYADPAITPWVHTVMYYNLFEDAGGAYNHDDFSEHRQFLLDRIAAGEPVGYHPETAYWVAFDDSVPIYAPLYMRSRWLDLDRIPADAGAPLPAQIVFSTGWEWGYWQNDALTFRQSVARSASWDDAVRELFAPMGERGEPLAAAAIALGELEHTQLLENRLAAYLAGRDAYIDFGDAGGIVGAPDRPTFGEVAAMSQADRDAFASQVVDNLEAFAAGTEAIGGDLGASDAGDSTWGREMIDGVEVTAARAHFIAAAYRATLAAAAGGDAEGAIGDMDAALDRGRAVVERRHAALHDPHPDRLIQRGINATFYQYGYLRQADELCYWERERVKVLNLVRGQDESVPACTM